MMFKDKTIDDLLPNYLKILIVNANAGTFVPVVVPDDEWKVLRDTNVQSLDDYLKWFAQSDFIHPDDRKKILSFDVTRSKFIIYRRRIDNFFRWVILEILSSVKEERVLTVKDINGIYTEQYEIIVNEIGSTDPLTGLSNRFAFERDRQNLKSEYVGLVFADINGLKVTNDTKGHKAGDELISKVSNLLSMNFKDYKTYHVSGDEFVVIADGNVREFLRDTLTFHKSLYNGCEVPVVSIGYSVGMASEWSDIFADAERAMYDDKRMFYLRFPEYKRG